MTRHKTKRHDVDDDFFPVPFTPLLFSGVSCLCFNTTGIGNTQGRTGGIQRHLSTYRAGGRHCMHAWYGWDIPITVWELGGDTPAYLGVLFAFLFLFFPSRLFLLFATRRWGMSAVRHWICGIPSMATRRWACIHRTLPSRKRAEVVMCWGEGIYFSHGMVWHDWKKGTGVIGFSLFFLSRQFFLGIFFFSFRFATAAVDHAMSSFHGYDMEQERKEAGSSLSIERCGLGEGEESSFVGDVSRLLSTADGRTDGGRGRPVCGFECFLSFPFCCLLVFVGGACDGVF